MCWICSVPSTLSGLVDGRALVGIRVRRSAGGSSGLAPLGVRASPELGDGPYIF